MSAAQYSPEELQALRDLIDYLERHAAEQQRREAAEKVREEFAKHFTVEQIARIVSGFPQASRERFFRDYPQIRPKP
jgi:plasmid stabilization system protein ParE